MNARVFLLSPARLTGKRARILMRPEASFDLALRLRKKKASLGDVFSFMSGLYFRGKLAYANTFASPPAKVSGTLIITSNRGLVPADTLVTPDDLEILAEGSVDQGNERYVSALQRDARRLLKAVGPNCSVVLLGSIATPKYLEPLTAVFGKRLLFPEHFIGRGDLSRGGLLLRASRSGAELPYKSLGPSPHHGTRPARL